MRNTWTSRVGLGACSLLAVLLLSDASWARPKVTTYVTCKCTCRAEDELGKTHEGTSGALQFTESSANQCLLRKCTVGRLQGYARDCSVTEHTNSVTLPPGFTPGVLQQQPTTPGGMRAPTTGTIMPRSVEGEQPTAPAPSQPAPASGTSK
jgi:hypothetical protein